MGYNDPVGDNHEQSNLLGSTRGRLSADSRELFGTTKIQHSDFRVASIKSIKISVIGHEDFEAYVDDNHVIKQEYASETVKTKSEFGQTHWASYVARRSGLNNQKTTDQFFMKYNRVVKTYTWNAPAQTSAGGVGSFPSAVDVPINFGDTVEFEVEFNDMGPYFENFRRYMHYNYNWVTSRQTGNIPAPIALTTSRGCANSRHAFQARYMFTSAQFTGDQSWSVLFSPNDRFNNHDNMDPTKPWGAVAILKPQPVSGVTLSTTNAVNGISSGLVCTSDAQESVNFSGILRGLTTGKTGDVNFVWQRDRVSTRDLTQFGTAATQSLTESNIKANRMDGSAQATIASPGKGSNITYNFKAYAEVSGQVHNYNGSVLATWKYKIDSTNTSATTLLRVPDSDNSYINGPRQYESTRLDVIARYNKKKLQDISPERWPSILVDTDAGATPQKLRGNFPGAQRGDIPNKVFNIYADSIPECVNVLEYHEDGAWKKAYNIPFSGLRITEGGNDTYDILENQIFWSFSQYSNKVETKAWPLSGPWRVTKNLTINNEPTGCSASTPAIHIVSVSQWDIDRFNASPVVETTYSNHINIVGTWQVCPQHVVTFKDENNLDVSYALDVKYQVTFDLLRENSNQVESTVLTKTVTTPKYTVTRDESKLFISGRQYKMKVGVIHCGYDMFEPTVEKRWQHFHVSVTPAFEVLDCNDPDIRDKDTGREIGEQTITFLSKKHSHKHKSHDIMWCQPNNIIRMSACRDYGALGGNLDVEYEHISANLTYEECKADAIDRGGKLAQFKTPEQLAKFNAYLAANPGYASGWIGLTDVASEGVWRWADGELAEADCTNWYSGEPNNGGGREDLANVIEAWGGKWNDWYDNKNSYFMQRSVSNTSNYTNSTYQYIAGSFSHATATTDASNRGGRLAVIKNTDNLNEVIAAWESAGKPLAYIGLTRDNSRGGWDNTNGWRWADGTWIEEYGVKYWDSGEPNNAGGETAVHVGWRGGRWNDIRSNYPQGYILELPVPDTTSNTVVCIDSKTIKVAEIKCYVRSDTIIQFSGSLNGAVPARNITTIPTNYSVGSEFIAHAAFYMSITNDSLLNTTNLNNITITPYNSALEGKIINFYGDIIDDRDDPAGPGNRGDVSIERINNDVCRVVITDPGGTVLSGQAHSTCPDPNGDRYHINIYATIL